MRGPAANRRVLANSLHHLPPGSVAKRKTNPNKWVELTVGVRRLKPLPDLSALDAKPPGERKYLTRDELRTAYGSDPGAVAKIEKFAADHHLVVTRDEPASARLGLAGTAANVNAAFGVKLLDYAHPKLGEFHARSGPVSLPAPLDPGAVSTDFSVRTTYRPAARCVAAATALRPYSVCWAAVSWAA